MENSEPKQPQISRPKIFSVLSLISAIAAGNYFIGEKLLEAIAFTTMASIFDSASIGAETLKQKNWRPQLKNAIDRTADAAIFIGFAMSRVVSGMWAAIALVLVIVLPYWAKLIWKIMKLREFQAFEPKVTGERFKISIRRFFHAGLIARVVYFIVYGV